MATSALKIFVCVAIALTACSVHGAVTRSASTMASEAPTSDGVPSSTSSGTSTTGTPKAAGRAGPTPAKSTISDANLDAALSDSRYLSRQIKCALGEAPCDPVGKRLKSLAPFVLRGACPKCTPGETRQIQKTLAHIQRTFPKEWARLVQTYAG